MKMEKAGMLNKAAAAQPKSGHAKPAGAAKGDGSAVGPQKRADMYGAIDGKPTDKNPLRRAGDALRQMHPERHDDLGPHHGKRR